MHISVSYDDLVSALGVVRATFSDKTIKEEGKTITFRISKDDESQLEVMAFTAPAICRTTIPVESLGEGVAAEFINLRSGELDKILSTFSGMSQTRATRVDFEVMNNERVRIFVHEEPLDEEHTELENTSVFTKVNIAVRTTQSDALSKPFPEDTEAVASSDVKFLVTTLLPAMSADVSQQTAGTLNFSATHAYVFSNTVSLVTHELPASLKDFSLSHGSVQLLSKILDRDETVELLLDEAHLCVRAGNYEAFLRFTQVRQDRTAKIVAAKSTELGAVINRPYFKDVLKRAVLFDTKVELSFTEDHLSITTDGFDQKIQLENSKGDLDGVSFKVPLAILSSAILGDDAVFDPEMFLYIVSEGRRKSVYLSDSTDRWLASFSPEVARGGKK